MSTPRTYLMLQMAEFIETVWEKDVKDLQTERVHITGSMFPLSITSCNYRKGISASLWERSGPILQDG